jgi:hypothetical protein
MSEDKAIGSFDESLQRLYMEFSKSQHESWQSLQANLKGRDFFRPGPLMRALESEIFSLTTLIDGPPRGPGPGSAPLRCIVPTPHFEGARAA